MGHLIEEYAKSLGVKIGKPVIVDHFYPSLGDKYITIHSDSKIDSKSYEYFPQVIKYTKLAVLKIQSWKILTLDF
jgi:arginine utilization protein RocB